MLARVGGTGLGPMRQLARVARGWGAAFQGNSISIEQMALPSSNRRCHASDRSHCLSHDPALAARLPGALHRVRVTDHGQLARKLLLLPLSTADSSSFAWKKRYVKQRGPGFPERLSAFRAYAGIKKSFDRFRERRYGFRLRGFNDLQVALSAPIPRRAFGGRSLVYTPPLRQELMFGDSDCFGLRWTRRSRRAATSYGNCRKQQNQRSKAYA
jgi:hypothetical protein